MRLITILLISTVISPAALAADDGPDYVSLDGDWGFTWTPASVEETPTVPPGSAFDVIAKVPGQWDEQLDRFETAKWWPDAIFTRTLGPMGYLTGIGWYRKTIDAPERWQGRAARLTVGWAVGISHVWLNGQHIAAYDYGVYTPYTVDLSPHLKPGQANELIISVDNTRGFAGGWAFYGNPGKSSGITRSVDLRISGGPGLIEDIYIRPGEDLKEIVCQAELSLPGEVGSAPRTKLSWGIREASGPSGPADPAIAEGEVDVPAFGGSYTLTWRTRIDDLKPWSPDHPNLYSVGVAWRTEDGDLWDVGRERIGLRRWSSDGRKLKLNGKPFYLRGEFSSLYFPIHSMTPTTREYWVEHVQAAKRIGLNYINFAARVPPTEMLEVADELGIIVQCGDHMTVLEPNREHYDDVWRPIVRWTRNHPSMSFYGFGGERNYYEGIIEQYQKQHDLIKSLNPECMVMPQQAIRGIDYAFDEQGTKELTPEPFPHHAERLALYTKACDLLGHYSGGAFGYSYFTTPWQEMEERFRIYDKPLSIHEVFMGMSYLDPDNAHKYTGLVPPYIYTKLRADLVDAGLLHKWRAYHLNSSRLQAICQKYCLEKVRKCNEPAGFEYLGMIDQHFTPHYTSGLLDEFFQVKPAETAEGILRYNDDSVLLLDFSRISKGSINRSYWAGNSFEADVMLSLYDDTPLTSGTLTWALKRGDKTLLTSEQAVSNVPTGQVSTLRTRDFDWPAVARTTRLNLSVTLTAPGYDLANDWDFWVFPRLAPPAVVAEADEAASALLSSRYTGLHAVPDGPGEGLRIVCEVTEPDVAHLEAGGDILLLGAKPFLEYTAARTFRSGLASRLHQNVGTVIAQHPIFRLLPHEGWGDWQFCPLLEGASCVLFDDLLATRFDPILENISCAGDVRKQASIFEKRVGAGRLLVSTCVFDPENPSCVALMDGILAYVTGGHFDPKSEIPTQAFARLTAPLPPREPGNLADAAPSFEYRSNVKQAWAVYGQPYEIDSTTAHSGQQSLNIALTPQQLKDDPGVHTGARLGTISFRSTPPVLRLSAWHKTQDVTGDTPSRNFLIFIYITYRNGTRHTLRLYFDPGTHDWQHAEKLWQPEGEIASALLYIGIAHSSGTAWIDDIYFGPAPEPVHVTTQPEASTWQRQPVTIDFDGDRWFSINGGDWTSAASVRIAQEGLTKIAVRKRKADEGSEIREVRIDATPPVINLDTQPLIDQQGGIYSATEGTAFMLEASDALSGVKTIEVSIDGKAYAPYREPLKLPPGNHELRCRATDVAGNRSETVTGECLTGGGTAVLQVSVE